MGSAALCSGSSSRSARLSRTVPERPVTTSRHASSLVSAALIPLAVAVLLIWKPPGPLPGSAPPCGARTAVRRSRPVEVLPDRRAEQQQRAAAHQPQRPAPRGGGRGRVGRDQRGHRLRRLLSRTGCPRPFLPQPPQIAYRGRRLQHGMHDERGEEHPGPVEVQRIEGAREDVVQLDVEHTRHELEQRAPDQKEQRDPLQRVRERPGRRQLEQSGHDRPQFRQQDGDQCDPECDVNALVEAVQPVRVGRPGEQVEAEDPLVRGQIVHRRQTGVVGGIRQQPGREQHRDPGEQHHAEDGGEPGAAHRAAPEEG